MSGFHSGLVSSSPTQLWQKYTLSHTNFQTAALTNSITLVSLPAKTVVYDVIVKHSTVFAGTASYTLSVGITGTLAKYTAAFNVQQAVSNTAFATIANTLVPQVESFTAAVNLLVTATSTTQNLSSSTAGAVDIWVLTSTLP
jgi:hypothetical protein